MEITEIRIKLMEEAGERLQAFCSITFDHCFVIRDLKIIDGTNGPFVAMPSRKLTAHCPQCGCKNHLRAGYCNQCGIRLNPARSAKEDDGRTKLYADIAHPINSACRESMQQQIIQAYRGEIERSKLPGYVSSYDDYDEDCMAVAHGTQRNGAAKPSGAAAKIDAPEAIPRPHAAAAKPAITHGSGPKANHRTDRPSLGAAPQASKSKPTDNFGAGIF
ncbi:MAG TPA: septation protein SpoVG family protein [Pirellulales bacterium]|nr:septation protein SpoVG family protein [Pirellulales bacterium]